MQVLKSPSKTSSGKTTKREKKGIELMLTMTASILPQL